MNIPEPKVGRPLKYPWASIRNNRPMLIKDTTERRVGSTVREAAARMGLKFSIRSLTHKGRPAVKVYLKAKARR